MSDKEKVLRWIDVKDMIEKEKKIVILFGGVYDLSKYIDAHPGGKEVINNNLGVDASDAFVKAGHLSKPRVLEGMARMRIGRLE
jgi:cytochrome b involved in lipid metabolism